MVNRRDDGTVMGLAERKAAMSERIGEPITDMEYLFLSEWEGGEPCPPNSLLRVLSVYRRGYEDGYQDARFNFEVDE